MSLPVFPNTTCDIYHVPNAPPAAPDVAAVPCCLRPDYPGGVGANEADPASQWTHVLLVGPAVKARRGIGMAAPVPKAALGMRAGSR